MRELDIGEVVKRSGVPASTLRYYEQLGLLQSLGRRGLRRQYDEQVLERLEIADEDLAAAKGQEWMATWDRTVRGKGTATATAPSASGR